MADIFSKQQRSDIMSRVRGRGNQATEIALVRLLRAEGIAGWRRHQPVFGKPDFIFRKERLAVFVDGCFWHSCPTHGTVPATRRAFWIKKFAGNKARDRRVNRELRRLGWRVLRLWEHELRGDSTPALARIRAMLAAES